MRFAQYAKCHGEKVMEQEITDLQARLSFQEDTIEQMTSTLVAHQNELYELRQMMKHLQKQISAMTPSDIEATINEIPPHY
jgi:SlyX protein